MKYTNMQHYYTFHDSIAKEECSDTHDTPEFGALCMLLAGSHALLTVRKSHDSLMALGDLLAGCVCMDQAIRHRLPSIPNVFIDPTSWAQEDACTPYDIAESCMAMGKYLADTTRQHYVRGQLARILTAVRSLAERHPVSIEMLMKLRLAYQHHRGPLPREAVYYHPIALSGLLDSAAQVVLTGAEDELPADIRADLELHHGQVKHSLLKDSKTQHAQLAAWYVQAQQH